MAPIELTRSLCCFFFLLPRRTDHNSTALPQDHVSDGAARGVCHTGVASWTAGAVLQTG